jgi:transcriptional repressor NrdR
MKCPFCRQSNTEVYNTRTTKMGSQLWRRRRCLDCHEAFTTYEAPDLAFLKVIKPHAKKPQRFSRAKLYNSLYQAFEGAPTKQETVDAITDTIEAKILNLMQPEIASRDITRITLITLKHFHTGAFLRYLSYQPELATDPQFKRELKKVLDPK